MNGEMKKGCERIMVHVPAGISFSHLFIFLDELHIYMKREREIEILK